MPSELVTLPAPPDARAVDALLRGVEGAELSARWGEDAAGQARVQITVAHPDPEVVARARQALLRRCQAARVRAFVV